MQLNDKQLKLLTFINTHPGIQKSQLKANDFGMKDLGHLLKAGLVKEDGLGYRVYEEGGGGEDVTADMLDGEGPRAADDGVEADDSADEATADEVIADMAVIAASGPVITVAPVEESKRIPEVGEIKAADVRAAEKARIEREKAEAAAKRSEAGKKAAISAGHAPKERVKRACLCGCGGQTWGTFVPGHDARLHSMVLRAVRAEQPAQFVATPEQAAWLAKKPWAQGNYVIGEDEPVNGHARMATGS